MTDELPARDLAGLHGPVDSGLSWRPPPSVEGLWEGVSERLHHYALPTELSSEDSPESPAKHNTCHTSLSSVSIAQNYHTVTIDLAADGDKTRVTLSQDNNACESARKHSENNWRMMLEGLKKVVEK